MTRAAKPDRPVFYVYEHWRPDRDECFHVGKGCGKRAYDFHRGRNRYHKFVQAKMERLGLPIEVRIIANGMTEAQAHALEIERIAFWRADGADLTNLTDGGEGTSGRTHTEEWKRATSARMKAHQKTPEHIAKIAAALRGRKGAKWTKSPEAVEKTRQANLGRKHSEETKARLSEIGRANPPFKGKTHTEAARKSMRAKQIGIPKSEETKARMRKPKSEAHKQKLREASLGKTHNEETRRILSEKAKADWARRKRILENNSSSVK